jgi:hypothetical protein
LRFDDFNYGQLNQRVKQLVEVFKQENALPIVVPKIKRGGGAPGGGSGPPTPTKKGLAMA